MSLARNSAWSLSAQLGTLVLGLGSSIVVARFLGPEQRGQFALGTLLVQVALAFGTFGLGTAYAYLAGRAKYSRGVIVSSALIMGAGTGLLAMVVGAIGGMLARSSLLQGLSVAQVLVASTAILPAAMVFLLSNLLIGEGRVPEASKLALLSSGINAAALALAAYRYGETTPVLVASLVATTGSCVLYIIAVFRDEELSWWALGPVSREAVTYGGRAYVGSLANQLWLRADVFVLNLFVGPAAVGHYAVATSLAEKVWMLDSAVVQAVLGPTIRSERKAAGQLVAMSSRNILLVVGIPSLVLAITAPVLIPFVYGDQYTGSIAPTMLLAPGIVALAVSRPLAGYFFGQLGRPGVSSAISLITAAVSLVGYFTLIPTFGAAGAAAASSIAYVAAAVVSVALFVRWTDEGLRSTLLPNTTDFARYKALARRITNRG